VVRCSFAHLKPYIKEYLGEHILDWETNERDAWVADAQRWICQIVGVLQCKVDLDEAGEITGVHVVAGMERDPRHIVRDVEGLLKARLNMKVYYKKIGVVQVMDNQTQDDAQTVPGSTVTFHPPRPEAEDRPDRAATGAAADTAAAAELPAPIPAILVAEDLGVRVVCGSVTVMAYDTAIRAEVQLSAGEVEASGLREGPNHAGSDLLLVSQATVAAVAELIADPVLLHLKEVRLQEVGGEEVVLAAVDLVEGRQGTTLFGTCSTRHNRQQAAVYAVLDALNRRLALHGLKTLAGSG